MNRRLAHRLVGLALAASLPPAVQAALNVLPEVPVCASPADARRVQEFYERVPGAPLPIPGRELRLPEVHVASGLAREHSVGIAATPTIVKDVWTSIEGWGAQTKVRLVFTPGGGHVLDFQSLVPMRQKDLQDGWLDIYADDGKGVHGHLWLDPVKSIHAIDIPGRDAVRTRAIGFYGADGRLIVGVYASISTKVADPRAVDGFAKTRALLAQSPRVCP